MLNGLQPKSGSNGRDKVMEEITAQIAKVLKHQHFHLLSVIMFVDFNIISIPVISIYC